MPGRNRPIGRGRIPFRKGRRWISKARPKRWNAVAPILETTGEVSTLQIPQSVSNTTLVPPLITLVSGQADVEPWADEQEVTIDRIVGSIHIITELSFDNSINVYGNDYYFRAGILLNEELSQGVDPPELMLFQQETMEDYEWMWLWSGVTEWQNGTRYDTNSQQWMRAYNRIDIDIRNRRKVGQSDELNLYMTFAPYNYLSESYAVFTSAIVDVRSVMVSK